MKENGFALVHGYLLLLVIIALACIGCYFFEKHLKKKYPMHASWEKEEVQEKIKK